MVDHFNTAQHICRCTLTLTKQDYRLISEVGQSKELIWSSGGTARSLSLAMCISRQWVSLGLFMVAKNPRMGGGGLLQYCSSGCRVEELRLIDEQLRFSVNRAFP